MTRKKEAGQRPATTKKISSRRRCACGRAVVAERYARIKAMSDKHPINVLCAVLGVSHRGYYQWRKAAVAVRASRAEATTPKIKAVYAASRHTYGNPRGTAAWHAQGESMGRHRVARLMRAAGLQGRQRRRHRVGTTDSRHDQPIAPNRLASAPEPTKPNDVWVTEIT